MCDLDIINDLYVVTKELQVEISKLYFFSHDIDSKTLIREPRYGQDIPAYQKVLV